MLARYGFQPRDLIHQKEPLRVGDVLCVSPVQSAPD
jgi:hypothetical protein